MKNLKTLDLRLEKNGNRVRWALFLCPFCKAQVERRLNLGRIQKSCGCTKYKHGACQTKLYQVWAVMKSRCSHPGPYFGTYVSPKWKNFPAFQKWALSHGYSEGLYIDRKNNNKGYTPSNCRWLTSQKSAVNRRTTKLSWSKVKKIRELVAGGMEQKEVARRYGFRPSYCSMIVNFHRWKPKIFVFETPQDPED